MASEFRQIVEDQNVALKRLRLVIVEKDKKIHDLNSQKEELLDWYKYWRAEVREKESIIEQKGGIISESIQFGPMQVAVLRACPCMP